MHRRQLLAHIAVAGAAGTAGCAGIPGFRDNFDVGMSANAFQPESYTIEIGDTVRWYNNGSRGHTVTAYESGIPDGTFFASGGYSTEAEARDAWERTEGGNIVTGEAYEHTFDRVGQYLYFCIPHEPRSMVGDIVVEE